MTGHHIVLQLPLPCTAFGRACGYDLLLPSLLPSLQGSRISIQATEAVSNQYCSTNHIIPQAWVQLVKIEQSRGQGASIVCMACQLAIVVSCVEAAFRPKGLLANVTSDTGTGPTARTAIADPDIAVRTS